MISTPRPQAGFTAVELLITLFVAAAFLIAGYQLFNVVIKDGGQARAEAKASNIATDYLRKYSLLTTNPCQPSNILTNSSVTAEGLSNVRVTVVISCPNYSTTGVSKVDVTVTYNSPQRSVAYSTFTSGSSATPLDVTTGLVGWWKFNGNANDSSGNANNGTGTNVTLTTGQNGTANGAYSFNGSTSYINTTNSATFNTPNLTMSAWVKYSSLSGLQTIIAKELNYKYRWDSGGFYTVATGPTGVSWGTVSNFTPSPAPVVGNWYHVACTVNSTGAQIIVYVNGVQVGSPSTLSPVITAYNTNTVRIGSYSTGTEGFNGVIDDARFYNRVLSPSEITTVYNGGAK